MTKIHEEIIGQETLPMFAISDPALNAAVTTAIIDGYSGVIITLTGAGNAQTLQDPTDITAGKRFTVVAKGAFSIEVNGITMTGGEAQKFIFDGASWVAITAIDADDMSATPHGDIVAINVQDYLDELEDEKIPLTQKGAASGVSSLNASSRVVEDSKLHAAQHVTGGDDVVADAVSEGNAGLMTGADKKKLDDIETAATADQIASEVPFTPAQGLLSAEVQAAIEEAVKKITIPIKEENVSALTKGQVVCAVGASGEKVEVGLCNCTDLNKIRIMGLVSTDLVQNAAGHSIFKGELPDVDTRSTNLAVNPNGETWAEGAILWVADTAGGMTHTRPTHGRSIKAAISRKGSCADDILQVISHVNPINLMAASGEDIILGMGDSAGANKVSGVDYAGNEKFSFDSDGNLILNSSQIANNEWNKGANFAGTDVVNMFKVNVDDEIDVGGTLVLGASIEAAADSGAVTFTDMPISATPAAGTEMSFTQKIDGTNILTVGAEADSAGSIQNPKVVAHCGINLKEITTPTAKADYGAVYSKADNKLYFQDGAGVEHEVCIAGTYYGEMYLDNNSVATVIETAATPIMVSNYTVGGLSNFTFVAGSTGAITAYSDGTGKVNVASTAHGLVTGDYISIRGTTNYNGLWAVTKIDDNNFSIPDTWVANDGASDWDRGSHLIAGTGAAGNYSMFFNISAAEGGGAGSNVKGQVCINGTLCTKCIGYRKFANNDLGNLPGGAVVILADGDKLYFVLTSTGTNDITCQYGNVNIHRL